MLKRRNRAFLTRYDFHLGADRLIIDDQRFSWDTHFGGSIDAIDYVVGRLSGIVEYQAILGDEFRAFDPNQCVLHDGGVVFLSHQGDGDCWCLSSRLETFERSVQAFPDRLELGRRKSAAAVGDENGND